MAQPIILSTWTFGQKANAAGWPVLAGGGCALDAVEQGCIAVEADPEVNSVGYGGTPDRAGGVSLDGCIMLSPAQRGGVCYVQRFMHPVSIARRVMEHTPHVLLAGDGAEAFAESQGFTPADLLTDAARQRWRDLKAKADAATQPAAAISPANREEQSVSNTDTHTSTSASQHASLKPQASSLDPTPEPPHDTVGVLALDSAGTLAGACSTSGLPLKLPGRVGDSPIVGHGLYVDPDHAAVVATGTGELVMGVCATFLAVELIRQGAAPAQALHQVLTRITESYNLQPHHQVGLIALQPDGQWAQAALRPGYRTAVRDAIRDEVLDVEAVVLPAAQ